MTTLRQRRQARETRNVVLGVALALFAAVPATIFFICAAITLA